MLPLYVYTHTESPEGQRLGRHIHYKRRIWRFGFDDSWTSQTHLSVKNKATRNVSWVYCIQPSLASVAFRIRCKKGICILTHTWGFRRCSFRTDRAMRRPTNRGTSDRLAPRFLFCISTNKKITGQRIFPVGSEDVKSIVLPVWTWRIWCLPLHGTEFWKLWF